MNLNIYGFDNWNQIHSNFIKFNKLDKEMTEIEIEMPFNDDSDDEIETFNYDEEFKAFGIQKIDHDLGEEFPQLSINPTNVPNIHVNTNIYNDDDYDELIIRLNRKQKIYLSHIINRLFGNEKFHHFVTGKLQIF